MILIEGSILKAMLLTFPKLGNTLMLKLTWWAYDIKNQDDQTLGVMLDTKTNIGLRADLKKKVG